jgi:hypothetical protein
MLVIIYTMYGLTGDQRRLPVRMRDILVSAGSRMINPGLQICILSKRFL